MTLLRTLLVDDEPKALDHLRRCCIADGRVNVVAEADHGDAAIAKIRDLQPDLVLLDIQMRDVSGLRVVREIGVEQMPLTIFVTGFNDYAVQAFEVNAVDYLLKPFDAERFGQALDRAIERLGSSRASNLGGWRQDLSSALQGVEAAPKGHGFIMVERAGRHFPIAVTSIESIEASGNYVVVHHPPEKSLIRARFGDAEQWFPAEQFLRVHRSHIVNLSHLKEVAPNATGDFCLTLRSGAVVESGRRFRPILVSLMKNRL